MNDDLHDFEQFMKRREDAARAYVLGDAAPLGRIVARVSPATFFGPRGGYEQGSDHVYSIYERDATHFTSAILVSRSFTWQRATVSPTG